MPYEDVEAWQKAIEGILLSPQQELLESMKKGSLELAREFLWDKNVEPLRNFLREPHHLPDFEKVTMPNLFERAHAVYRRGGQELILKRSAELFGDILKS